LIYREGSLGERARGPGTGRRGRRVGVCPKLDPGSVAGWCGGREEADDEWGPPVSCWRWARALVG
jgi:hypothetical protein